MSSPAVASQRSDISVFASLPPIDCLPDAVLVVDESLGIIGCNDAATQLFGYSQVHLLQMQSICELVAPHYRAHQRAVMLSVLSSMSACELSDKPDVPAITSASVQFEASVHLTPAFLRGAVASSELHQDQTLLEKTSLRRIVLYVCRDMRQHNTLVRQATEMEQQMRLLVDSIMDYAIMYLDPRGLVNSWNKGAERMFQYTTPEVIGTHFSRFYPSEAAEAGHPAKELSTAVHQGRFEEEGVRVRKDGSTFIANAVVRPILDTHHILRGYAKITRDVSERLAADSAQRRNQEQMSLLFESIRDYAILFLDQSGVVTSWNRGAQDILQYTAQEAIGTHFSIFYREEDRIAGHPQRELDLTAFSGRYEEEGVRMRKDGSTFTANVVVTCVYDVKNAHKGYAKVMRDISNRSTPSTSGGITPLVTP